MNDRQARHLTLTLVTIAYIGTILAGFALANLLLAGPQPIEIAFAVIAAATTIALIVTTPIVIEEHRHALHVKHLRAAIQQATLQYDRVIASMNALGAAARAAADTLSKLAAAINPPNVAAHTRHDPTRTTNERNHP